VDHNRCIGALYQFFRLLSRLSCLRSSRNHFIIHVIKLLFRFFCSFYYWIRKFAVLSQKGTASIVVYTSLSQLLMCQYNYLIKDQCRIERSHSGRRLHEWLFRSNSSSCLALHWICSWIWISDSRHLDSVWGLCNTQ